MSSHRAEGQLETFLAFQATVEGVNPDGRIRVKLPDDARETIDPVYYGGVRDTGVFMSPDIGDTILCVRVHPGSKGVTQGVRVLAAEAKDKRFDDNNGTVPSTSSPYPRLEEGALKILSRGGSELHLRGRPLTAEASLTVPQKAGIYIAADQLTTVTTTVGNIHQNINSGSRLLTGDVIRQPNGGQTDVPLGHELNAYCKVRGIKRGLYEGVEAQDTSLLGAPRNPALSEYRLIVNEFSEQAAFTGWDEECDAATDQRKKQVSKLRHKQANDQRTSLSLAPHQLIEVVAGNVVNSRGEVLDINYGTVNLGDSSGRPIIEKKDYEVDRIKSRRGLGYHFQLSTNSKSDETSNDIDNFVFGVDKQGLLKVSVPRGSGAGNVLYPTSAKFGDVSGGVVTEPLQPSGVEGIPVTLRDDKGNIVLPAVPPSESMNSADKRTTGIRFTNSDGYFRLDTLDDGGGSGKVRVNFTAYHNMYAAAEMLIANTIQKVNVPENSSNCPGFVLGTAIGQPFERFLGNLDGEGKLKDNELLYMSTVAVSPGKQVMYAGGRTIVAGTSTMSQKNGTNRPYTNSFQVSKDKEGNFSYSNTDGGSKGNKNPGGKSANINFEGSVDLSVGKDDHDQKSLVLDTAGSLIAWFGRDKSGRSVVVQTDGDVAVNVGGRGSAEGKDEFREGRFDLRVNVNDKGPIHLSDSWDTSKHGGDHASDYIISISKNGLVIAGMNPGNPMVIRNDGDLSLESTGKLILASQSVEIREGNKAPRKTWKAATSSDQPPPNFEDVQEKLQCILDLMENMLTS